MDVAPPVPGTSWGGEFLWNHRDSAEIDDKVSLIWSGRESDSDIPDGWGELLFPE